MKIVSFITEYRVIKKILTHINYESQPPEPLAHSPPLFRDTLVCLRSLLKAETPLRVVTQWRRFASRHCPASRFAPCRPRPAIVMVQGTQARRLSIGLDIFKAVATPLLTSQRIANSYTYFAADSKFLYVFQTPLDSDDTIVPPSLDHLTIDARVTNEAADHAEVVFEAIRDDQRETDEAPTEDDVVEHGFSVSIGATADETTRPQAGGHLDGRKEPRGPALAADERIELIGLKLNDLEVPQHLPVEALRRSRGPLEPTCNGVAGTTREAGRGRNAHALDSQARYLLELPASTAKAAVRRARIRADGSPT